MRRTTVMLPEDLRDRAFRRAREEGTSLGELVRRGLEEVLGYDAPSDPLYADSEVYEGPAPQDLAAQHDRYLYDEGSDE